MSDAKPPRRDVLGMSVMLLAALILLVHATSWALPLDWLGKLLRLDEKTVAKAPHLALADILIWLAGALLLVRVVVEGDWKQLRRLTLPGILLAALAVASAFVAGNRLTAVAKSVQYVEYFILLYLVFTTLMNSLDRVQTAVTIWTLVAAAVGIWGLVDYLMDYDPVKVSGPFADRNVYSGYLALVLPLAFGMTVWPNGWRAVAYGTVLVGLGLATMLAGGPLLGALVGIAVILVIRWHWGFALFAAGLVGLLIWGTPQLQHDNPKIVRQSIQLYDEGSVSDASAQPGPNARYLQWQAAMKPLTPGAFRELGIGENRHIRQLLIGVGIGNYQLNIDQYYGTLPKPNKNTTEPNTENFYLVLAVEAGIPAGLVFLWLIVAHLRRAAKGYLATDDKVLKGLLLGCIGALASLIVTNLFTNTLVHGTGPATVLLLALAAAVATIAERKPGATT